jgi:hypothetical protein
MNDACTGLNRSDFVGNGFVGLETTAPGGTENKSDEVKQTNLAASLSTIPSPWRSKRC